MKPPRESVEPKLTFSAHAADDAMPKRIDFFALPRPVQERFLASTRRAAPPVPIIFRRASRVPAIAWGTGALTLAVATYVVTRLGFGNSESTLAYQRPALLAVYAALAAAAAFGVVRALAVLRYARSLPFAAGVYVYPWSIIDASTYRLRVHGMSSLAKLDRRPTKRGTFVFSFTSGASFSFDVPDVDVADRVESALVASRDAVRKAIEEEGPRSTAQIDPLFDGTLANPLGPTEPLVRTRPAWIRFGWAIALGVAAVVAPMAWLSRNAASDEAMFAAAKAADTVVAYDAYVAKHGKHAGEVTDLLEPRAALRDVVKSADIGALLTFAKAHPNSDIQPEIDAAVRSAMLSELEKAKQPSTVTALNAFAASYPDTKPKKELAAAIHALYAKALDSYEADVSPNADAAAFVQRLLAYAEKHGPTAEIRFRHRASDTVFNADAQVAKSRYFNGDVSLPSKHFSAAALASYEHDVAQTIADRFAKVFPADIVAVVPGAPLPDADTSVTVPTLVLDYDVEWSRTTTVTVKPRGVFVGLHLPFDISFFIPDGSPAKTVKAMAWKGPDLWKLGDDVGTGRGDRENYVYGVMAKSAFDLAQKKTLGAYFKAP
jgi:hypothetical protein